MFKGLTLLRLLLQKMTWVQIIWPMSVFISLASIQHISKTLANTLMKPSGNVVYVLLKAKAKLQTLESEQGLLGWDILWIRASH